MRYIVLAFFLTFCFSLQLSAKHYKPGYLNAVNGDANTADICPDDLLAFAQTLLGTPYRSSSSNPLYGFDCSGFVNYVFKNFNFTVPRSSYDFASVGEKIRLEDALPGDIILFTGTKTYRRRKIGHVGIIICNDNNEVKFIHSTSGKEHGVTISSMDRLYRRRFVQIVRLLRQNSES